MHWSVRTWVLEGNPWDSRQISLESPFCIFLSSPVLCPVNCSLFDLLGLWAPYELTAQPDFLFLPSTLETLSKQSVRAHLSCFCLSGINSPFLPVVLCLKSGCFIYIVQFFHGLRQEGTTAPCYSILAGNEIPA